MWILLAVLFETFWFSTGSHGGINWVDIVIITVNIIFAICAISGSKIMDECNSDEERARWSEIKRKEEMPYHEKFLEEQKALLKREEEKKKRLGRYYK